MALLELTIIGGVYLGTKLWERAREVRATFRTRKKPPRAADLRRHNQAELEEEEHYMTVSSASLLTTSVGYVLYPPISLLNIGLITYTTVPMIDKTARSLMRDKKLGNDALSGVTALVCLGINSYFAASLNNLLYYVSTRVITRSRQAALELTAEAYRQQPGEVFRLQDGERVRVPLTELQPGDIVVVTVGEAIPFDGVVMDGKALIDQQALTGELEPCEKVPGDTVMAATLVLTGTLWIPVTHGGTASEAHRLNEVLAQTVDFKTTLQLKGEDWSERMALPWLGLSAVTALAVGPNPGAALLFSIPNNSVRAALALNTVEHLRQISRQGVFIKDGRVLEQLPRIDTILFDKTGTLTLPNPEVARILPCAEFEADTLLAYAAAAEQQLQHPIANALRDKADERGMELPEVTDIQYDLGFGVTVRIDERTVKVGSRRFILEALARADLPASLQSALEDAAGHSFVFIAVDQEIAGAVELSPRLRPEMPALIAGLRRHGFRLAVVSGDQYAATARQVQALGLDEIYAEVLPRGKAALIQALQEQGRHVCFIGDGLNDAIAMKQANVSICLAEASEIANQMAQVVFLNNHVNHLEEIFEHSRRLDQLLNKQLNFWIGYGGVNAACILVLGFGVLESSLLYLGAHTSSLLLSKSSETPDDVAFPRQALQHAGRVAR